MNMLLLQYLSRLAISNKRSDRHWDRALAISKAERLTQFSHCDILVLLAARRTVESKFDLAGQQETNHTDRSVADAPVEVQFATLQVHSLVQTNPASFGLPFLALIINTRCYTTHTDLPPSLTRTP